MDTLSDMGVFVAVAKAGSFKTAAQDTGLTSSGVSKKIGRFEDRLGVKLIHRTTRTLSLTEAGRLLFERGQTIIDSLRDAEDAVQDLIGNPRGHLRIAASAAITEHVLIPFIKSFSEEFPDISVTFIQADGGIEIIAEHVDFALLFHQPSETTVISRKLLHEPWVVCASPEYLERNGAPKTPHELCDHRCLAIHAVRETVDQWEFVEADRPLTIHIDPAYSGIGLAMRAATRQGLGVARLSHWLVSQDVADGMLIPLLTDYWPETDRAIYAVYPDRQYLPLKTRVFLDRLQNYMRENMIRFEGL